MKMDRFDHHARNPYENLTNPIEVSDDERARDFIETGNPAFLTPSVLTKVSKKHPEELARYVDSVLVNNEFLLKLTRALHVVGALDVSKIRNIETEVVSGGKLRYKDALAMLKIQESRYLGRYPESMRKKLRSDLLSALKSPNSRFYICRERRDEGGVAAYIRFDDRMESNSEKIIHMASFMTDAEFEGGALGQALLATSLPKELEKEVPIHAECDPSLVKKYQEFGFRVEKPEYVDSYGVPTVDIVLVPQSPESVREAA